MNNEKEETRPRNNHGGPGSAVEKPKNLGLTLKKMVKYLKKFGAAIMVALVLAALSSVFSIIGPNKLSDLTDEISSGLVINKDNLTKVSEKITSNLNEETFKNISTNLLTIKLDEQVIGDIYSSTEISNDDKAAFKDFIQESTTVTDKNILLSYVTELPSSITKEILPESVYNEVLVTTDDKIAYLKLMSNMYKDSNQKEMINIITKMPTSIKKILLPEFTFENTKVTTDDQVKYLSVAKDIDKTSTDVYKQLDKMPSSIRNLIKPSMNLSKIKGIALFLLIIYLISAVFNYVQSFIMATVSNLFSKDLRSKISAKINKLPLKYFDNHSYGDILSRVTNDIDTIGVSMYQSLGSLVGAVALFIGSIIMMFATNWIMAITAILSSLFGFIFMFFILSKSQKYFERRQVELGKLNGHIEEIYSSHNVVKAYNGSKDASKRFDNLNDNLFECDQKSQFLSGLMPSMMSFIGNFGYVCVCIVGALLVTKGSISFGVIVAFIIYVRLFSSPLSQIAQGMMTLQSTAAAGERVFEFIEEPEMNNESNITGKLAKDKVAGNIIFDHVKFGYDKDKVIIKDFNCNVKPGEKIAIVGPTGAGKTTMVNLLMKFYEINSGEIIIDGVPTSNLTRENIHDLFVMVLQDTWLFNGTIKENIIYNKKDVSDEEVRSACKTVGLDHFIKTLPNGYDTVLSDAESISAGQKQLLTIARGMIEKAPFLILDEATSSVDTRTEELVQKAMDKLTEGKTSFIIAHRLSTIKNADLILVMNEGNIIEQGTHKQLMKKNGFYADLYNSQFRN